MIFSKIISFALAFVQFVCALFGIGNFKADIDFGGTAYVQEEIAVPMTLIENGSSEYVIVRGLNAVESEIKAANELQSYLKQISGVTLPIVTDEQAAQAKEIIVGETSREGNGSYTIDRDTLGGEGFMMFVEGENLIIAGGKKRGTLYGVYTFLEERLGCRWYTQELEVIPESDTVIIDAELNDTQVPSFEYRYTDWYSVNDSEWRARQKINCNNTAENGGGVYYAGRSCHTFATSLCSADTYFEENPEYFMYNEETDERDSRQLCLSNPYVLEKVKDEVRSLLEANPEASLISLTQNDYSIYCECDECKKIAEQYGGQSGINIWFVNKIAEEFADEYPDVMFQTFAYLYTRSAPTGIVPADNVCIYLCSIECCFCHPLSECGHIRDETFGGKLTEQECSFSEDIKDWAAICDNLYIWDYTANFNITLMPFMNFQVMSPNINFFLENNVKGIFEEGLPNIGYDGGFGAMKAYVLAKLMWNPDADVEYYMRDFAKAYYGEKASEYVMDYLEYMTNKISSSGHQHIWEWHYDCTFLTASETSYLNDLWSKAKESCQTDEQLLNIRRSELEYRTFKADLFLDEFSVLNPLRYFENKELYYDLKEFGIIKVVSGSTLPETPPNFIKRPIEWSDVDWD